MAGVVPPETATVLTASIVVTGPPLNPDEAHLKELRRDQRALLAYVPPELLEDKGKPAAKPDRQVETILREEAATQLKSPGVRDWLEGCVKAAALRRSCATRSGSPARSIHRRTTLQQLVAIRDVASAFVRGHV
jgi:hypothetical protein